ncbi:MAG: hypothetical protein K2X49_03380 [Acetobacteraceae bacterium]|nr:hypothetical protein [Acetobacteraceae bacterium]
MSEDAGKADPLMQAAARLEAAVERLAEALGADLAERAARAAADGSDGAADMVPRTEVAALADRLDTTINRLRGALAEELRRAEGE